MLSHESDPTGKLMRARYRRAENARSARPFIRALQRNGISISANREAAIDLTMVSLFLREGDFRNRSLLDLKALLYFIPSDLFRRIAKYSANIATDAFPRNPGPCRTPLRSSFRRFVLRERGSLIFIVI